MADLPPAFQGAGKRIYDRGAREAFPTVHIKPFGRGETRLPGDCGARVRQTTSNRFEVLARRRVGGGPATWRELSRMREKSWPQCRSIQRRNRSAAQLPQGAVLTERRLASVPMSNNHAAAGRRSLRLRERRLLPLGNGCRLARPDSGACRICRPNFETFRSCVSCSIAS